MTLSAGQIDYSQVWRTALALGLGALSGLLAFYLHAPLPWMIGPLVGVTIAALSGVPLHGPNTIRPVVIPVLGVMLGSSLTPAIFAALGRWATTLILLIPFLIAAAAASYAVYRRIGGYDRVTAYFCAMPGGLNDMVVMGAEAGGNERKIALAHAARIFVVVVFVVLFFGLVLGVTSGGMTRNWVALSVLSTRDWLILTFCAAVGAPLAQKMHLPAAPIFGPMLLSGAAHILQLVALPPPSLLIIVAQVVIGTVLGSRFIGASLREVGWDLVLGFLSALAMLAVALLFAGLVAWGTNVQITQAFLAFSPGGLAEMSLLALAMGQDVAYVSVLHVVRITLVIGAATPLFRMMGRRRQAPPQT